MSKRMFAIASAGVSLLVGGLAYAEDVTFDASATILEALALNKVADLAFASIVPDSSSAGTVVVSTSGTRTCNAPLTCSGSVAAADFTVAGSDGASFAVTLPSSANISNGTEDMLVSGFNSSLTGNSGTLTGGSAAFQLGATLNVGAAQAAGAYTGTFTVTVEYN